MTVSDTVPHAVDDIQDGSFFRRPDGSWRAPVNFDVLRNDTGINNTPLTITVTQQPAHGAATLISTDESESGKADIAYQSNPGYVGPDSFRYTVTDADSESSAEATVTLEVVSIPFAQEDTEPTNVDLPVIVHVLANDGGLAYGPLTVAIVGDPVSGTAVDLELLALFAVAGVAHRRIQQNRRKSSNCKKIN